MLTFVSSIRRKKQNYGCIFYTASLLLIGGIGLIVAALILNKDAKEHQGWKALGCIGGSVLIILGCGFSTIFWHFGKERHARHVLDYETANESKRVPKEIEQKMELAKQKNKAREEKHDLERQATMQSNRTVQTILPGSRVTSMESSDLGGTNFDLHQNTNFQPIYEDGFDNKAFN